MEEAADAAGLAPVTNKSVDRSIDNASENANEAGNADKGKAVAISFHPFRWSRSTTLRYRDGLWNIFCSVHQRVVPILLTLPPHIFHISRFGQWCYFHFRTLYDHVKPCY